jgi:hypothetical protein
MSLSREEPGPIEVASALNDPLVTVVDEEPVNPSIISKEYWRRIWGSAPKCKERTINIREGASGVLPGRFEPNIVRNQKYLFFF